MSTVVRFPKLPTHNPSSDHQDSLECEWCSAWVAPLTTNVDGRGYTYLRDEQGDVICDFCLQLPPYYVRAGNA